MGFYPAPGMTASATIEPARIVKISGSNTVATCGANEAAYGVSGTSAAAFNATSHATSGLPVTIHCIQGEVVEVVAGGNIAAGDLLKSDASGGAVAAATTGTTAQNIVGVANEAAASGDRFKMTIRIQNLVYPALA